MDLHLLGKVAIVTGGASGIGAAIALQLAREQALPVILDRAPLAPGFADELAALCPDYGFFQLELSDEAACADAVARTVARHGGVDALVNNAGVNDGVGLSAGRAAFLLVGATLATMMTANVAHWIIPGQKTVIAQMKAGQPVDAIHGQRAKQRSVHNTYFGLPVLIAMLSNHYGWLYQGKHNWLVLVLLMLAGALIRHSFVARHKALVKGVRVPWEYAAAGTVLVIAVAIWLAPKPAPAVAANTPPPTLAQVSAVVQQRCVLCHNAQVQNKNVALHTPELIVQHAQQMYQQAVVLKLMPMNNATQITDEERAVLKRWFEAGAKP